MKIDPVTLEVVRNALPAISNEMSYDLQRTSYNMMIYEVGDYCCSIMDVDGKLLSQNTGGVSHFVSDLGVIIQDGVEKIGRDNFKPGDVIITNHQAVGGQHLNNVCVYVPFFFKGELIGFPIIRAHWIDVGGMSTGFGAQANVFDPWMEGLQLDQIKIYEAGEVKKDVVKLISDNVRFPDAAMGDMRAQIASCHLAQRRLEELFIKYGRDVIFACVKRIFEDTEVKCRKVVEDIPDGVYEAESFIDDDNFEKGVHVPIKAKVTILGSDMTIDLSEGSKQVKGPINSRTLAGPRVAYKSLTVPLDPVNEGSFNALKVIIPEGNLMMAKYPAPMPGWSTPLPSVIDTILKALAPAMPDKIPAAHLGVLGGTIVFFGYDPNKKKNFIVQSIEGGGWGGRPFEDGESASVSVCQGDVRNAPIENIELKCPVIIEERILRKDSGGAGKFRGGLGLDVKVKNLVEGRWNLLQTARRECPPWGLYGGKSGSPSDQFLRTPGQEEFESVNVSLHHVPGDSQAIIRTAGGGGWGNPLERDPEMVYSDVLEGFVSMEAAKTEYGVVLNPSEDEKGYELDMTSTNETRTSMGRTDQG
ncbi:MAG: hydantoinase B/oxoprolinase family protein [Desulfobacterales bacterium]|nr:hydantoinase B/oxoprolinase family protein [Desulfobacterales bacterium]